MKRLLLVLIVMLIGAVAVFANGDGEEGAETTALEGYSNAMDSSLKFDLQWKIEGENLMVQMAAPTTGWLSVGFDAEDKMAGANILIGYVEDGMAMLRDDYGSGAVKHEADSALGGSDDFSDVSGSEADGTTIISFTIPLNSGDSNDKPLEAGKAYKVIYAYGPNGKDDFGSYHTKSRGTFEITL